MVGHSPLNNKQVGLRIYHNIIETDVRFTKKSFNTYLLTQPDAYIKRETITDTLN